MVCAWDSIYFLYCHFSLSPPRLAWSLPDQRASKYYQYFIKLFINIISPFLSRQHALTIAAERSVDCSKLSVSLEIQKECSWEENAGALVDCAINEVGENSFTETRWYTSYREHIVRLIRMVDGGRFCLDTFRAPNAIFCVRNVHQQKWSFY